MRRLVNAALAALLASAGSARAQVRSALDREAGIPAGLALPVPGIAAAEEPAGIGSTPAAAGFVRRLTLQWFREIDAGEEGSRADGLYAAAGLGPVSLGASQEWVRPGDAGGRRYRKGTLALATGDGRTFSLGFAWNRFSSPDPSVEPLSSWDAGLTVRPHRHLSLGAAALGRDAGLGGERLPSRWVLGIATRLLGDGLTLSADLVADDRARDDFHATHLAFGLAAELRLGVALAAQVSIPLHGEAGRSRDPSAVVALSWNGPYLGLTGGLAPLPGRTGGLFGLRSSAERYRAPSTPAVAAAVDLQEELRPGRVLVFTVGDRDPYGRLLARLAALRNDPDVAVVLLKVEKLPLGPGRVEELRAAVRSIRERKPVLAWLAGGGTKEYWLASSAAAIAAPPGATVEITGISTSRVYLRDALARLGVAFEVVARGAWKSAPEPLVRSGPSPEAREVADALLDDLFGRFVADVAAGRGLPPARVRELVDRGLLGAEEAKEAGLVDAVLWPDELEGWASARSGGRTRLVRRHEPAPPRAAQRWGPVPAIEIVRVDGTLVSGESRSLLGSRLAGAETIARQLRRAAGDRSVKAIVLRVDSPGGDGLASDLVWRAVVRARDRKPVVASMGDAAASGGYLAAVGADAIVAEPSTLTGSIGVFALKPDLSGLLGKLAAVRESRRRGELSEIASPAKPWTPAERAAVERRIAAFYSLFVDRVAGGRGLSPAEVEEVAGGRVWTGRQAFDRRLVDRLGSLADAVALARERAGIPPGDPVEVRRAGAEALSLPGLDVPGDGSHLDLLLAAWPEAAALPVLAEMGTVLALPVEWVLPAP